MRFPGVERLILAPTRRQDPRVAQKTPADLWLIRVAPEMTGCGWEPPPPSEYDPLLNDLLLVSIPYSPPITVTVWVDPPEPGTPQIPV